MTQTILYVDDEQPVLRAMSRDLRPWLAQRELNLQTVDSAQACLQLLETTEDDVILVITDLRMPGMKGSELIQRLSRKYPETGLVLLTAYSDMEDITKAVSSDIYGLIVKPWDVQRLTTELDRMVTRVRSERRRNRREYELESQLKMAGEFQYRLFERPIPLLQHYEIEVSNRPAPGIYVTGDYYEVIPLSDTRVLFLLGDAAGHGVKSAFIATTVKTIIDDAIFDDSVSDGSVSDDSISDDSVSDGSISDDSVNPVTGDDLDVGRFLNELNRRLLERLSATSEAIISFSAALLDAEAGTLQFAGGGNPPPCVIRERTLRTIPTESPALGCSAEARYPVTEVAVQPGDRLVMCTDGVYERGTDAPLSWEVLSRIFVQAHGSSPFIPQVERILGAMQVLETSDPEMDRHDDLTILTARLSASHD
ncbi:MAG: fused response regulator/phosphatase [Alkalispirochaeta sp.]